ncbi:activating signal cointegrator 1 isoform X2 [Nilaparvata lugens]|uniref:activating signal cointegrator 1 isoform X1 n=1 Tax=Nilaparvata lugens TaxID=108931 RepID=UPI00193D7303|nr:activating signal cointegrator 1 isoform X1 [Nilaparvata lugens]XP_039277634.1 activating signal cointegrator 1 isoform X2 [Nilaparvata lugens]
MSLSQWMNESLSTLLDFPVPEDMIQYILGIENSRDLEDYLKTLLDFKNEKHKKFFHELVRRKQKSNSSQSDTQGTKKLDDMKEYLPTKSSEKKKKSTKNEESPKEIKENSEPSSGSGKKKSKYVNIYSPEGQKKDTILLKGN